VFDQRRNGSLDHIEHVDVRLGRFAPRVEQIFVAGHGERIPTTQQLDLYRLHRSVEAEARLFAATQPLEVRRIVAIHGDDQIGVDEIVGMDLPTDVADLVTAQATFVRSKRVRRIANMFASGRSRVEHDVSRAASVGHMPGDGLCRWRTAMVPQTDEENAKGLGHTGKIQAVGVKRRNRKLLLTTKMLDEAIAALATIGESIHDIASGMAATL
jgi:hypothetical protein